MRLTRRGRLVVLLVVLAVLLGSSWLLTQSGVGAVPERDARPVIGHVVVQPGETLWEIAGRVDPEADRRVTVARIVELNGLSGAEVGAFQRLAVPVS